MLSSSFSAHRLGVGEALGWWGLIQAQSTFRLNFFFYRSDQRAYWSLISLLACRGKINLPRCFVTTTTLDWEKSLSWEKNFSICIFLKIKTDYNFFYREGENGAIKEDLINQTIPNHDLRRIRRGEILINKVNREGIRYQILAMEFDLIAPSQTKHRRELKSKFVT